MGASVSTIPKTLCDVLGFREFDDCSLNLHLADSPIKSLFWNMNLDNEGTEYDPPLPRRCSRNSKFLDLDAKFGKNGIGEVMTLNSIEPTIADFKEFDYDHCSLEGCISLLQNPLLILLMLIVKIKLLPNISFMP